MRQRKAPSGHRFARRDLDMNPGQRRGGHARGARRRRPFDHGDLRFLILQLVEEEPRHGYEIIKAIEEAVGGAYSPSPGVVYPTLTLLEELGQATVAGGDGGKKLYAITDEGSAFLKANQPAVDAVAERLRRAREQFGGGPPPEILRAVENLRMAIRLRLGRGPLSEQELRAVTAALDAAAVAVEQA